MNYVAFLEAVEMATAGHEKVELGLLLLNRSWK